MRRLLPLLLAIATACEEAPQPPERAPPVEEEVAPGIFAGPGEPLPSASAAQKDAFARGLAVARRSFSPADGLGPEFNVTSCLACHERPGPGGGAARFRSFLAGDGLEVQPHFSLEGARAPDRPFAARALRNPSPFLGAGLLAEIPDDEIRSRADPDDLDGDGIRGRAGAGRFGRKAQHASIEGLVREQLRDHLGIATDPLPRERREGLPVQEDAPDEPTGGAELGADDLADLVAMAMLMAAPAPDAPPEGGRARFEALGCAACHVPALRGPRGLVPAYTDLLLHDMGSLGDGLSAPGASGRELRTQPLWGIAAVGPYLHDGRAGTVDAAILAHDGEAAPARDAYAAASERERQEVIAFLESLGGRALRSSGLLPPRAPIPAPGQPGAPLAALAGPEAARFLAGREVFDRDVARGVGPGFNADSCRACHFQPAIGGAGPIDVDVIRQALPGGDPPPSGSMLHRHATAAERPMPAEGASVLELRQTQPLFGLGLVDRIPDDAIRANADPDDADGDGISGRVHELPDGRLGRFGWKAQVPSLAEFTRDALTSEMGITVPATPDFTFGATADGDAAPDPELSGDEIRHMDFFIAQLAPLPRVSTDAAAESRGEALFAAAGCDRCHVPELGGVRLFSDLLLHDTGAAGVRDGDAGPAELRTPPLWGIASTGPYLHNGRALTLEDAIAGHGGEAGASRAAFEALPPAERADLVAFLESL